MKLINTEINYTDKILIKWDDKFLIGIPVIDEQHTKNSYSYAKISIRP